ncbi:MAG: carboxypeptidase regulatory-like domain-containing protein [Endomicrobiia bacterium]
MSKKIICGLVFLCSLVINELFAETISGTISYLGMTSTGKFWVWASTLPVKTEGSYPVALSSYNITGNNVSFPYTLIIPAQYLPAQLFVYAIRDWHPPFVEDFLSGQTQGNPIYGDPFGEFPGGVYLSTGVNLSNISFSIKDPPQGRIWGDVYYEGLVSSVSVLRMAVGRGEGEWPGGPADYKEVVNPSFPYRYEFNFLADATDYYIVMILDDLNSLTSDPFIKYGPVVVSSATGSMTRVNLTFPVGKISGTIYYDESVLPDVFPGDELRIMVGRGQPQQNWDVVSSQQLFTFSFPYYYTLYNIPDGNNFYVLVRLVRLLNGEETLLASALAGPVEVSSNNNRWATGVNMTLQLSGGGSGSSIIEGVVNYPGPTIINGPLVLLLFRGEVVEGNPPVAGKTIYNPLYPQYFRFDGLQDANNYKILAFVDANNDQKWQSQQEPSFISSTLSLQGYLGGITLTLSNPQGGAGSTRNSISGNVTYSLTTIAYVHMKIGYGTDSGIYNIIQEYQRYGSGFYKFENLPDADNYYISAFADLNNNSMMDSGEPSAYVGPIRLTGGVNISQNIELIQREIQLSSITVIISGKVYGKDQQPIGGVTVSLLDTRGDSDTTNDMVILSTESFSSYQESFDGVKYNFRLPAVTVKASSNEYLYSYKLVASKPGYKKCDLSISFYTFHNSMVLYYDLYMETKPQASVENLSIRPTTITPDNDNVNDYLNISLKYVVNTTQHSYDNAAKIKFVIDTNKDNEFSPINWNMFVWDNQNRVFIKKDPDYYVDFSKPLDYSKLIGPLTQEEYDKIVASYDTLIDYWIDGYSLTIDYQNNISFREVSFTWDGKDNAHQVLKNGTYKYLLVAEDYYGDIIFKTTSTLSIAAPSIIGYVKDEQGNPVGGAKISCGNPTSWGSAFSADDGSFEVSGLKANEQYHIEVQKEGYVNFAADGIVAKLNPTAADRLQITLKKGVEISGYIILPKPPKMGELVDHKGYVLYNLWVRIEAQNLSGGNWVWKDINISLPSTQVSVTSAPYTLYVNPNSKIRLVARTQGYISKETVFEVGTQKLNINLELTKAAKLVGTVKIPEDETFISELLTIVTNGVGLNVWANTKDNRFAGGSFVWFSREEILPGAKKTFVIDTLTPNTTYTIGIDAQYIARVQIKDVYVAGFEKQLEQPIVLSLGAKIAGTIQFGQGVYEKIKHRMKTITMPSGEILGVWVSIGLESQKDYSRRWYGVVVSSKQIANSELVAFSLPGLQQKEKYKIIVEGEFSEGLQIEDDFIIEIPTSTLTLELSQPIRILVPTGVLKGKLVNNTGKQLDPSRIRIMLVLFEGGGFYFTQPDENFNFTFNNIPTGEGLIWGSEYSVKPGDAPGDFFGIPTGNAGMFGMQVYSVHGSTVDIGEIPLKPAGKIEVLVKGPQYLLEKIYSGTTTYLEMIKAGQVIPEGPYGLIRVQPIWLKRVAEIMHAEGVKRGEDDEVWNIKEISIGIDNTIQVVDAETLKYTFYGAEEGTYNIYVMVGKLPLIRYRHPDQEGDPQKFIVEEFTVSPVEQAVIVKPGETKIVEFNASEGVEIIGSVIRPSLAVNTEETISVTLRDRFSGKVLFETSVVFDSTNKTQLTGQFKFIKVPPGEYILLVLSANYKSYSKILSIPSNVESLTLTPIMLNKGANIVGRLVDQSGNPVTSGVLVECFSIPFTEGSYKNTDMPGCGISKELINAGEFKLSNLPEGTYILKVTNKSGFNTNYINTTKTGIIVPNASVDVDAGEIVLKPAVEITGKVYASDGKTPLSGVEILVYPQDMQLRPGMECWSITDRNGFFSVKGINPGIRLWEIKVNPKEKQNILQLKPELAKYTEYIKIINVTKEEYRTNLKIVLALADAEIKGTVTTKDAGRLLLPFEVSGIDIKDYPAAVVLVQSERDITSGDPMSGIKVLTNSDGTFEVKGISKGKYVLKIFARGYTTKVLNVNIVEGMNDVGTIELEKGIKVSGTIRTKTGQKIQKSDVKTVVASTRNFSKIVFGFVHSNPITKEVEGYEINGLENGVTYYLAIVPEGANYVVVNPEPLYVSGSDLTYDLIYQKPKPHFEVKSYKFKDIRKEYISKWIQFFELNDLNIIMTMPQETWATHLFIAQLFQHKQIDIPTLSVDDIFDLYLIFGFITEPIIEENVEDVVSIIQAGGALIPFYLSDTKKQLVVGYIPQDEDISRGYFEFKFSAVNYYGEKGEELYRFYLGEDARVEKIIVPLTGGNATIGENDSSGLEVIPGTEFEGVDVSTEVKIVITKLEEETLVAGVLGKLSPRLFSSKLPKAALSYPGDLASAIYDMKVQLISGPLAVLAKNNKLKLNIKLYDTTTQEDADILKLCYFNETTNKWEIENVPLSIDWDTKMVSAEVTHLSKFAIFKVKISTGQPYSGEFKTYVYPNPVKNVDRFNIRYCLPGTGKVKVSIKIYNIAGELVRTLPEQEVDAGYIYNVEDIELTNDKGEKLASGIYFYYLQAGDYKKLYKFAIIK